MKSFSPFSSLGKATAYFYYFKFRFVCVCHEIHEVFFCEWPLEKYDGTDTNNMNTDIHAANFDICQTTD